MAFRRIQLWTAAKGAGAPGAYTLTADVMAFNVTLQTVGLRVDRRLPATVTEFALALPAVGLRVDRKMPAETLTFSLALPAVTLRTGRVLPASVLPFSLTLPSVGLRVDRRLPAQPLAYSVTLRPVTFEVSGEVAEIVQILSDLKDVLDAVHTTYIGMAPHGAALPHIVINGLPSPVSYFFGGSIDFVGVQVSQFYVFDGDLNTAYLENEQIAALLDAQPIGGIIIKRVTTPGYLIDGRVLHLSQRWEWQMQESLT